MVVVAGGGEVQLLVRHPDISTFPLDDDLVLYDARDGAAHVLNATAALVWTAVDGMRSATVLARGLAAHSGIAEPPALADVCSLLADLRRADLLVAN
ncbi:MAG: PqqD family protein [Chloroflexota bacterium]